MLVGLGTGIDVCNSSYHLHAQVRKRHVSHIHKAVRRANHEALVPDGRTAETMR